MANIKAIVQNKTQEILKQKADDTEAKRRAAIDEKVFETWKNNLPFNICDAFVVMLDAMPDQCFKNCYEDTFDTVVKYKIDVRMDHKDPESSPTGQFVATLMVLTSNLLTLVYRPDEYSMEASIFSMQLDDDLNAKIEKEIKEAIGAVAVKLIRKREDHSMSFRLSFKFIEDSEDNHTYDLC